MGHDDVLWNGSVEDENVRVNMTKMKALTAKVATVTLIGKGNRI
jgi:hypothetical protein